MESRKLGASGLKVSSLCLGAMTFGEPDENSMMHGVGSPEEVAFAILDRALEAGVDFVDTANIYGQDGLSERVLGRWFARSGRRDDVVLATKFRFRTAPGANNTGASRRHIVKACEDSLLRLQTDRIDLYQIHMQDVDTPEEETLRALDDLVRAGKVLYVGCSNYAAYRLVDSVWTSRTRGLERFVSLQAHYSLVERNLERELAPACRELGLGILPWSPLGGGFLTGKYRQGEPLPADARYQSPRFQRWWRGVDAPRNWAIMDAVREVAASLESTPARVAIAWLLRKPQVTSVIFGARTVEQLEDNLAAAALVLPEADFERLEAVSRPDYGYPYDFIQPISGRW